MVRGISLVGIGSPEEVLAIRRRFPDAYFELPYNLRNLECMAEAASGRIASLHSLCPRRDFFPNFASDEGIVVSWSSGEMMKDAMTAGLAIGACSHAVGTSKAIEIGETEGAMSGLAIGICGIVTVVFAMAL